MADETSVVQKQYKAGLDFHNSMGFTDKWPKYERYRAGDQWPKATERTANMPRPVFNIVDFIVGHKVSQVANENVKMIFRPEEEADEQNPDTESMPMLEKAAEGADKFTKMAANTWEDLKQDELNDDLLDSAGSTGTSILHYYEDTEANGGITLKWKGKLAGQVIDAANWFPGNPQQKDPQKQPYHIISSREMLQTVKDKAKANKIPQEKIDQIQPDSNTEEERYDTAKVELEGSEKVTVLLKYWRENNTIWYSKTASGVEYEKADTGLSVYPIAVMRWKNRKKCAYGVGEVEGIITNQNAINFNIAMLMLSIQDTAWPKIYAKLGALQQQITNQPGEVIIDYKSDGLENIKYMQPPNIQQFAAVLVDKVVELTRNLSGVNEAASGEPFTNQLNAAAIIALQKAAQIPIESIRKRYYRCMEDVARIWEEFYKVKYVTERTVMVEGNNSKQVPMRFKGSDYADFPMKLKVDIGPSSSYSEPLAMTSLDKFLDKGYITVQMYVDLAPENVVPFREKLKKMWETQQQSQTTPQPMDVNGIVSQLTPEEQAYLQQHPELLNQIAGGGANGMSNMPQPMQNK